MEWEPSRQRPEVKIEMSAPAPAREECAFDGRSVEEILTLVALGHGLKGSSSGLAGLANDVVASTLRSQIERSHKDHLRESGFLTPENDGCTTPEPHKMAPPPLVRPARRPRAVMRPIASPEEIFVVDPAARRGPVPSFSFGCVPRALHVSGSDSKSMWMPVPRRGAPSVELLDSFFAEDDEPLMEPAAKRAKAFA